MEMRRCLAAALLSLGLSQSPTQAQVYPDRVVKLIVPYSPGTPPDGAARIIAQQLQSRFGQSFLVENRPGGGTTIGVKSVVTAPPDGYTLLIAAPVIAYYSVLYPHLDFDPLKSLAPVATVFTWSHLMVVAPSVPAKTMGELVAHAKANPGKVVFGFGSGTTPHVLGSTFKQVTGLDLLSVPFRGGEQARAELLGGRVHINMAPVSTLLALVQDGRARALAFTGPARSPDLPDVPTMTESGLPQVGYDPDAWVGILAPANTPPAIVNRLNAAMNESLKSPEMETLARKLGYERKITTPQEFAAFLAREREKWPPLIIAAGIQPN